MKYVFVTLNLLTWSQHALAFVCSTTPVYNATFKTPCIGNDVNVLWPGYQNAQQYVKCLTVGHPITKSCPTNTVFDFRKQKCIKCNDYEPAPACQVLKGIQGCKVFTQVTSRASTSNEGPACNRLGKYSATFVPACVGIDIYMDWPNYKNQSEYYWCQGAYNPQIKTCPTGLYFNYYAQACTNCNEYVAAPQCHNLPFDKINKCTKI